MSFKIIERLERIDQLIANKKTGTPSELSKRMKVSERQLHNYLNLLKKMGTPLCYCVKSKRSMCSSGSSG
ncbi:HTH domain-containing protein [Paraflavisolibacter caeni]|uniref:HTH domain-containing protein n=1 Tax=Paraflavisolibacter caeni TaxID=2982496 RepID=UPI003C6DE790